MDNFEKSLHCKGIVRSWLQFLGIEPKHPIPTEPVRRAITTISHQPSGRRPRRKRRQCALGRRNERLGQGRQDHRAHAPRCSPRTCRCRTCLGTRLGTTVSCTASLTVVECTDARTVSRGQCPFGVDRSLVVAVRCAHPPKTRGLRGTGSAPPRRGMGRSRQDCYELPQEALETYNGDL